MAGQPITSKPVLTDVALNDVIYIVDVSDTSESAQGTSKQTTVDNVLGSNYKSYVALLTQSGTSAPTATVLKNDTGLTFAAVYDDVGNYFLEPNTAPNPNKVATFCTNAAAAGDVFSFWRDDKLTVSTRASGTPTNSILSKTAVEIRIYP